jgi:predicted Co/Zn/Cd cation transporter (cation efflux family)
MAIDGAMALMVVLLIVQVWLLSAALDAYLAGYREAALPAAIVSGILFLVCLGLFLMIDNVDRRVRRQ